MTLMPPISAERGAFGARGPSLRGSSNDARLQHSLCGPPSLWPQHMRRRQSNAAAATVERTITTTTLRVCVRVWRRQPWKARAERGEVIRGDSALSPSILYGIFLLVCALGSASKCALSSATHSTKLAIALLYRLSPSAGSSAKPHQSVRPNLRHRQCTVHRAVGAVGRRCTKPLTAESQCNSVHESVLCIAARSWACGLDGGAGVAQGRHSTRRCGQA